MQLPDELLLRLKENGTGPTLTLVVDIMKHLLEKDKDRLVVELDPKTQGKAIRCQELIKLFTQRSEG